MKCNFLKLLKSYMPSLALMVLGFVAIAIIQLKPPQTGTVIAIFHPQMSDGAVLTSITHKDIFLMTKGPTANSYVVRSNENNLPRRLKEAGAVFVLNYIGAAGCSSFAQVRQDFPPLS